MSVFPDLLCVCVSGAQATGGESSWGAGVQPDGGRDAKLTCTDDVFEQSLHPLLPANMCHRGRLCAQPTMYGRGRLTCRYLVTAHHVAKPLPKRQNRPPPRRHVSVDNIMLWPDFAVSLPPRVKEDILQSCIEEQCF